MCKAFWTIVWLKLWNLGTTHIFFKNGFQRNLFDPRVGVCSLQIGWNFSPEMLSSWILNSEDRSTSFWPLLGCQPNKLKGFSDEINFKLMPWSELFAPIFISTFKNLPHEHLFYRTRIRSLSTLLSNWLTHWLMFSKLEWCNPCQCFRDLNDVTLVKSTERCESGWDYEVESWSGFWS